MGSRAIAPRKIVPKPNPNCNRNPKPNSNRGSQFSSGAIVRTPFLCVAKILISLQAGVVFCF